jgi:hypothetical protein
LIWKYETGQKIFNYLQGNPIAVNIPTDPGIYIWYRYWDENILDNIDLYLKEIEKMRFKFSGEIFNNISLSKSPIANVTMELNGKTELTESKQNTLEKVKHKDFEIFMKSISFCYQALYVGQTNNLFERLINQHSKEKTDLLDNFTATFKLLDPNYLPSIKNLIVYYCVLPNSVKKDRELFESILSIATNPLFNKRFG